MFQLNGSFSDVQKTKTKTASSSRFWLPKIYTLEETIEEVPGTAAAAFLFPHVVDLHQRAPLHCQHVGGFAGQLRLR